MCEQPAREKTRVQAVEVFHVKGRKPLCMRMIQTRIKRVISDFSWPVFHFPRTPLGAKTMERMLEYFAQQIRLRMNLEPNTRAERALGEILLRMQNTPSIWRMQLAELSVRIDERIWAYQKRACESNPNPDWIDLNDPDQLAACAYGAAWDFFGEMINAEDTIEWRFGVLARFLDAAAKSTGIGVTQIPVSCYLSANELATIFGLDEDKLRTRLLRWSTEEGQGKALECASRAKDVILYKFGDVMSVLQRAIQKTARKRLVSERFSHLTEI